MSKAPARSPEAAAWRRSIVVLALTGALLTLAACPGVAAAGPLRTGVAGIGSDDPLAMQHVREAGAGFVHIAVGWSGVAPRSEPAKWDPTDPSDPSYDWAATDLRVTNAVQAGLVPVILIDGGPSWAQRCQAPAHAAVPICDPDPSALATFATAAARRYSGSFGGLPRVRYWQGLNEPNLSLFFNPQFEGGKPMSPRLYRQLINAFYAAVKSVDGSNLVLAAGLGPIARPGSTIGPMRFARLLLCMAGRRDPHPTTGDCEGGVRFDIFDIHPYTTGGPTHKGNGDDVELGDLEKLRELIEAANRAGRIHGKFRHTPIWITEFSWDSKPPDPGGLSMRIAARWTAMALHRAWSNGIDHFFWFSLRDWPTGDRPYSETLQSGLYFSGPTVAEDRPKAVFYAFRFPFVAFPDEERGFSFWGRTPTGGGGRVVIQARHLGSWRTVAAARASAAGIFQGTVETTYGRNGRGVVRARFREEMAIPFSLREVRDFYQPPFG